MKSSFFCNRCNWPVIFAPIFFARAIVRNPRLFVLDEATSSIDTETEKIIQRR